MHDVSSHTLKLKVSFQRSSPHIDHSAPLRGLSYAFNDLVHAIDLSAAFDTVDHEILLSILETRFAIQCTALDWLRSYLTSRTHVFVYADKQTVSYPVLCSVPQGSVFGPLGFISYTEDIMGEGWPSG